MNTAPVSPEQCSLNRVTPNLSVAEITNSTEEENSPEVENDRTAAMIKTRGLIAKKIQTKTQKYRVSR